MSKVWGVSLAALLVAGVWLSSRPWSLTGAKQSERIRRSAVESLQPLKCHWGRHWITTASLSVRWDQQGNHSHNNSYWLSLLSVRLPQARHVTAFGTSPVGSNVQGQISWSQNEQLKHPSSQRMTRKRHKSMWEGLKGFVRSRKASVDPRSPPTDPCSRPSPGGSWWPPWLPRRCWSCSAREPPCCPSPAGTARLGGTEQRKSKNPFRNSDVVEYHPSAAIRAVYYLVMNCFRWTHFPSSIIPSLVC